ncbi:MAG: M4 family metallopeptidase [Hymenobacteraceae bacterium]|nr:M4 family metallopeptidase [Hymenobacteraceae bacterium]
MLKKYPMLAATLLTGITAFAQSGHGLIRFKPGTGPSATEASATMRAAFGLDAQSALRPLRAETDELGFTHQRYQQVYQGVSVERAVLTLHQRQGRIESISGEAKSDLTGLSVRPAVGEADALAAALRYVGARKYMWQTPGEAQFARESEGKATFRPVGERVIVTDLKTGRPALAWKFNVYAAEPVSRAWIYVDARTGQVLFQDAIIKHAAATATFATAYSGTRSLANETVTAGSYRLRETTRGLGIETYNARKSNSYTAAVDFTDADNNWTAAEYNNANFDNVAGDAHFGAQATYDYWSAVHARNSYDNAGAKIKSYVHFDDVPGGAGFENAYWNGSVMTYGDGASTFKPLTALDVCAHEIGHAVCEKTANLAYQNESGGMNEGFSDIWGAAVEARTAAAFGLTGKSTWLIGEEIMKAGGALRSMSNPNQYQQPDTYKGTYWVASVASPTQFNDYGGVHTNSGVLNFWFYLLSQGGSGTNDKSSAYTVAGITIDKAAKIAFRTESVYLSANSTYADARTGAIQAATDLYGAGSAEVIATTNAWYAVGVGAAYGGTTTPAYCDSRGTTVTDEWIDLVQLGSINRTSAADGGYYDGTALSTSVAQGSSQTISYSTGFASTAYTEFWNVWVDFNGDKDFADAGEQVVVNRSNATATTISSAFTIPATATVGATRMRVAMKYNAATTGPCEAFQYGEVEDYTLNITTGGTATCSVPTGLSVGAITSSGATASWTAVSGVSSYTLQYKTTAAATWTSITGLTTTSRALTGLAASASYQVQVQSVCSGSSSAFSAAVSFTTSAGTTMPTYCASKGTSVSYEYIDKVAIGTINRVSGADAGYYNGSALSTSVGAGTSQTITVSAGFVGTAYGEYFRIYADWNNNGVFTDAGETLASSASSTVATDRAFAFTVPAGTTNGDHRIRVVMSDNSATASCGSYSYGETEDYTLTVTGGTIRGLAGSAPVAPAGVYPNPATDALHLSLPDGAAVTSATVYDLRGARMAHVTFDGRETLDITSLPAGMYAVVLSDGTQQYRVRFAKQ